VRLNRGYKFSSGKANHAIVTTEQLKNTTSIGNHGQIIIIIGLINLLFLTKHITEYK